LPETARQAIFARLDELPELVTLKLNAGEPVSA
jgi:hypothetical protein